MLRTAALLVCLALPPLLAPQDLGSKDPLDRLEAVEALAKAGGPDAEKQLVKALGDDDWEVVTRAAEALGRIEAGKKAAAELQDLCLDGAIRAQRLAAARLLATLDPEGGFKAVAKKLSGETAVAACEALVVLAPRCAAPEPPKALGKLLKDKELRTRAAAAAARVACARGDERVEALDELTASELVAVAAGALEGAAADPRPEALPALARVLQREALDDVLERRALRALALGVGALEGDARARELEARLAELCGATPATVAARGPRLAREAARLGWVPDGLLLEACAPAREHPAPAVRAAAAHALGVSGKEALAAARALGAGDASARVREAAVRAALALAPADDAEQLAWLLERLAAETVGDVRETLVVALGVKGLDGAASALAGVLDDAHEGTAVCAAVSLGRTRAELAVSTLAPRVKGAGSWSRRGAALVGLCATMNNAAVPTVIEALGDAEPLVARTALGWLAGVSKRRDLAADPEVWRAWWKENEKRVRLEDPAELEERRRRLGYAAPPSEVYQGQDVLVLESRGDHIQTVLGELGIQHRLTSSSRVPADGVDAAGVFVANCTGECEPADLERLSWFVRVGGYLFGSCWALHETIERVAPGRVRKLETRDEVLDKVVAAPWATDSPYLEGVFDGAVRPIYSLVGAHLIEVVEPERVEVLVDSPECAERWGGGNLACWFPVGHGKVLDSVNHFDLQGLEEASWLKKPEERMAYAVDHMGTSYARIRETRKEKFWSSNQKASKEVRDLSVFKLVTNFVRLRRLGGQ